MKLTPILRLKFANLLFLLGIITFCICFKSPVDNFLNRTLVKPLISKFDDSYLSAVVMLILLIAIVLWLWISTSKKFILTIGFSTLLFYLTQRWNSYWLFKPFILIPQLYTWDIVVLLLVLPITKWLFQNEIESNANTSGGFIEEQPIIDESGDDFNRSIVARKIAELVLSTQNKKSFAIGIVGEYGSGKTSFIHLITNHFPKESVEIIWFNPWSCEKSEYIGRDFFDKLAHHLYYLNPKLSSLITTYSRKLSRINTTGEKLFQQLNFLTSFKYNIEGEYDQINELLKQSNKKIIVIIDDVDRLYSDEIMEVLRTIRNTASFCNMIYLVAYEHRYVLDAIRSVNENVADNFLYKIIQLEIPLPKREKEDLIRLLESKLQPLVDLADYQSLQENIIPYGLKTKFAMSYENVFRNSRDIIRFINGLQLSYQLLKKETLFENLFILELLKYRFIKVYDLLYERQSEWLLVKTLRSRHDEYYQLKEYKEGDKQHLEIERELLKEYDAKDIELITSLLRNIFNDFNRHKESKKSIIYPMFFERYFRFRIAKTELSEDEFQKSWNAGLISLKKFIDEAIKDDLIIPLTYRLLQVEPKSKYFFEQLVKCIFYLGPKYITKKGKTSFDASALIDKLWNYDNIVANQYYDGNTNSYSAFLKRQFKAGQTPYIFENEIIYRIKETNRNVSISTDDLIELQIEYFKRHVAERGVTDDAMWILYGIRQFNIDSDKWSFEPNVIPIVKELILNNDPIHFLQYSIYFDIRDKSMVTIDRHIMTFFDTPEELRLFVQHHALLDEASKKDYLSFFDKCQEAGLYNLIQHNFIPSLARIQQIGGG